MVAVKNAAATGRWGEGLAREFLERCGFRCLAQRYRSPGGEIDLVMERAALLIFVEVKTRSGRMAGRPEEAVVPAKLRRLRRSARHYLCDRPPTAAYRLRFDVVAIEDRGEGRGLVLRHLPGIR